MMVMCTLGVAVVSAIVLCKLDLGQRRYQAVILLFVASLTVEMWPRHLPLTPAVHPKYVEALAALPTNVGVLDRGDPRLGGALYAQTLHQHPIADGYLSRYPTSVYLRYTELTRVLATHQFDRLCPDFKVRYVVVPYRKAEPLSTPPTRFPIVYDDHTTLIYDVKDSSQC